MGQLIISFFYITFPQWGTAAAETRDLSLENPELRGSPLKLGISQNIAMHASPTARFFPLSSRSIYLHFFPKPLPIFPGVSVAKAGSYVGTQNEIGHPAHCSGRLMQVPVLKASRLHKQAPKHVILCIMFVSQ